VDGLDFSEGLSAADLALHLARNPGMVTHLPGHSAAIAILDAWRAHSGQVPPAWVSCPGNPDLERLLAEFFECARGKPDDVEATHHTVSGPPGVGPEAEVAS
jgi:hypothetical protein